MELADICATENAKKNLDIEAYDVSLILCEQAAEDVEIKKRIRII